MVRNILYLGRKKITFQEVGNVLKLRNIVFAEATVLYEQREDPVVLLTSVLLVELGKAAVDGAPRLDLALCVVDARDLLSADSE